MLSSPFRMPSATAHCTASVAQSDTTSAFTMPPTSARAEVSRPHKFAKLKSIVTSCSRVMAAVGFSPSEMPFTTTHSWALAYQVLPPVVSTPLMRAMMVQTIARVRVALGAKV